METLTALLTLYQLPAIFAGAFFFGDSVILTSAYLAGQLSWSPVPLFFAAFLGTIASDTLWYLFGAHLVARFSGVRFFQKERAKLSGFVHRLVGEKPLAALITVKFLYGSRIAMILYVSSRGMPLWRFTLFNGIGAVIWLLVFIPLGYLAGKGIGEAFPYMNAMPTAIAVLIVSILVFRIVTIWMEKKTEK